MTDDERAAVDAAAKGLTRAAQNYTGPEDFVDTLRLWTGDLSRRQLVSVVAQLACQLSNFYDVDPLRAAEFVADDELQRWLDDD